MSIRYCTECRQGNIKATWPTHSSHVITCRNSFQFKLNGINCIHYCPNSLRIFIYTRMDIKAGIRMAVRLTDG